MKLRPAYGPFICAILVVLIATAVAWPIAAAANDPQSVKARPLIAGDVVPEFRVEDITGSSHSLKEAINGKYVLIAFVPVENFGQKNLAAYFRTIRSYIEKVGYQIFIVSTRPNKKQRGMIFDRKLPNFFIDPDHSGFMAMGLSDSKVESDSVISGIFFVGPTGKILSAFSSTDSNIPFSGDALVLNARVYKQIEDRNIAEGLRAVTPKVGPSNAGTHAESAFDPASSKLDPDQENGSVAPKTNTAKPGFNDENFAPPDESVLRLLTIDDVARTNSFWIQGFVGVTPYDARRDTWSPRWSPGIQFGRRYNRFGFFGHLALDQTFDFTQEVKRLDVLHVGLGVETLSLYGRIRSSMSVGFAILNSDTDIDSRGKIGWFADLRPISLRWGTDRHGAYELTPLGLNISVPVTRGIPLILVGYMTTLSFEWSFESKP
ncbi:hypothetical protein BH10BDE1_BH10BDE1_27400 [soil metagenome]